MSWGTGYDETTTECRDCGLIYDAAETEGTCVRCHPQIGRCSWCTERGLLRVVTDDGRALCSDKCRQENDEDRAERMNGRVA